MWWIGLEGVVAPADDDGLADRAVALACAARFKPVHPSEGGNATLDTENEAEAFSEWLAKAGDDRAQRRIRRLALCVTLEHPGGSRGDILAAAERFRQNLTR